MLNHYEFAMIIDSEDKEQRVEEVKEKILYFVKNYGGELEREDEWGRRKLAYPIRGKNEGYYVFWYMRFDGKNMRELVKRLRLIDPLKRFMFIKRNLKKEERHRIEKEKYLKAMEILKKQQMQQKEKEEDKQQQQKQR